MMYVTASPACYFTMVLYVMTVLLFVCLVSGVNILTCNSFCHSVIFNYYVKVCKLTKIGTKTGIIFLSFVSLKRHLGGLYDVRNSITSMLFHNGSVKMTALLSFSINM